MKRNEWEFEYTASKLAEAARAKLGHYIGRVAWWKEKQQAVMQEIKESGLEITESLAVEYASSSASFGAQVTVRPELKTKLQECFLKIKSHEASAKDYSAWIQVLDANPEIRLKLNHDDWLFFFGER